MQVPPFRHGMTVQSSFTSSQSVPVYSGGQVHVYDPWPVLKHVPPFLQGLWLVQ